MRWLRSELVVLWVVLLLAPSASNAAGIVLLGDSWGVLGGPSIENVIQAEGHPLTLANYSVGGSTAAGWSVGAVDDISAIFAANTDVQAAHLIVGGNDLIAGVGSPDPLAVIAQAVSDTVAVLSQMAAETSAPILYSSYDYGPAATADSNAGLDLFTNGVAAAILSAGLGSQVTAVNSNGLMQVVIGGLTAPDPSMPGPAAAYADNIHLTTAGYDVYAQNLYDQFYASALPEPGVVLLLVIAASARSLRIRNRR